MIGGKPPIRYEAVREGLSTVAYFASEMKASFHMPKIGCGLAGGDWDMISQIIEEELVAKKVEVIVYNYKK